MGRPCERWGIVAGATFLLQAPMEAHWQKIEFHLAFAMGWMTADCYCELHERSLEFRGEKH